MSKQLPLLSPYQTLPEQQLPKTPSGSVSLEWTNLSYSVISKNKQLDVLKEVSGSALPGECLFILGPSGGGKTTLLNLLADRLPRDAKHPFSGSVKANVRTPVTQRNFGKFGAYIMQDDSLYYALTPREALRFSARLRIRASRAE